MFNVSKKAFQQIVQVKKETCLPVTIGSNEKYYKGKGNLSQRLNICLSAYTKKREEKLMFLSTLLERKITTSKDLTIAEAHALMEMLGG